MTQVQTISGLKRGRGRGRGRGAGRGRGGRGSGRNDKPGAFQPFRGSGNSLSAQPAVGNQPADHASGVFAAEQQHLAGVARLQQQHDEATALRAVQLAELERQQQQRQRPKQQQQACASSTVEDSNISDLALGQAQARPSASASSVIDLCNEGSNQHEQQKPSRPPAKPREQATWSLGVDRASSRNTAQPSSSSNIDNPFWCPARYIPAGGENQADLRLQTLEIVQVLDSGLVAHRGSAILDTGLLLLCAMASIACSGAFTKGQPESCHIDL